MYIFWKMIIRWSNLDKKAVFVYNHETNKYFQSISGILFAETEVTNIPNFNLYVLYSTLLCDLSIKTDD